MISIEAIVRPERVSQVTAALVEAGCPGFYYYNITGQGRQHGVEVFVGRGGAMATRSTVPNTLIRTVINEDQKDAIVAAIVGSAKGHGEGAIGDGKIFVSQVEDAVRVRTGDHGAAAI